MTVLAAVTSIAEKATGSVMVRRGGAEHPARLFAHVYNDVTVGATVALEGITSGASTTWVVSGVLSGVGGSTGQPLGPELLPNNGFDTGVLGGEITGWQAGWSTAPIVLTDDQPLSGAACARCTIDSSTAGHFGTVEALPVDAGRRYSAQLAVRSASTQAQPRLRVLTAPTAAGANYFGQDVQMPLDAPVSITTPSVWQTHTGTFTVPAGHVVARYYVMVTSPASTDVHLDSASLRQII